MKTDMRQLRFHRLQQLAELQRAQSASQLREAAQRAESLESSLQRVEAEYTELIRDRSLEGTTQATASPSAPRNEDSAASPQDLARKERYREFLWNEIVRLRDKLLLIQTEVTQARETVDESETAFQRLDRLNRSELDRQRQQAQRDAQVETDEFAARAAHTANRRRPLR